DDTEALLVRKDSDGGDIFTVDTVNSVMALGGAPDTAFKIKVYGTNPGAPTTQYQNVNNHKWHMGGFTTADSFGIARSGIRDYITINNATTLITFNAPSLFSDKVIFTQTDGNEYIDSDADGTLDLYAGTSIELHDATNIGDGTNEAQFASDGELTLAGTARVMRSVDFEPDAVKKGGIGPADSTEDDFPIHDYDSTNDESVHIHWEIPHWYASGGEIHLHVEFFVDTAPVADANVTWGIEYKKLSIGDNFDFTATTTVIVNTALTTGTPANDKKIHSSAEIHLTTTGFEPMDVILIRIFRDANAATDNFGSDARVFNYHLMGLSDKLGQGT
ncbi:hypothetical protein LCGC14_1638470, partial [marine sediment metagenome]